MKLGIISQITFGLYHKAKNVGEIPYLQVSQFDGAEKLRMQPWDNYVPQTPNTETALLKPGQIVLAGKGHRLFAWAYNPQLGPIVPSSVFFVITPDTNLVHPEYLTMFLNLPRQKALYHTLGAGTNIPSIRKSEIANLEVTLPAMHTQEQIVALSQLHTQEIALLHQLQDQKQALHQSLITELIHR